MKGIHRSNNTGPITTGPKINKDLPPVAKDLRSSKACGLANAASTQSRILPVHRQLVHKCNPSKQSYQSVYTVLCGLTGFLQTYK